MACTEGGSSVRNRNTESYRNRVEEAPGSQRAMSSESGQKPFLSHHGIGGWTPTDNFSTLPRSRKWYFW